MRVRFIFDGDKKYDVNIGNVKTIKDLGKIIERVKNNGSGFLEFRDCLINVDKIVAVEVVSNE